MISCFRLNFFAVMSSVVLVAGCNPAPPAATKDSASREKSSKSDHDHPHPHPHKDKEGHSHGEGPHGGTLADWGGGKFHVEFLVDHAKQEATVYVLGSDEKTPTPIKTTEGKLVLTITQPAFQVDLTAQPQEGEADGNSSRFVGKHEKLGNTQEFAGTIVGEVDGTPYAGDFKEEPHGHEQK